MKKQQPTNINEIIEGLPPDRREKIEKRAEDLIEEERQTILLCPLCSSPLFEHKAKVICKSDTCTYRIVLTCCE